VSPAETKRDAIMSGRHALTNTCQYIRDSVDASLDKKIVRTCNITIFFFCVSFISSENL
jgi:hypothetical protein